MVLNEDGRPYRSTELVPGYRFVVQLKLILCKVTLNPNQEIRAFTNPLTGEVKNVQPNRAGLDYADFDGFQKPWHLWIGRNQTSEASLAAYNNCVFPGDIDGSDICAATNGLNREEFDASINLQRLLRDASDRLTVNTSTDSMSSSTTEPLTMTTPPVCTTTVSFM